MTPAAKKRAERDRRFAKLVAMDGLTYSAAWVESAEGYPKPEPTPGRRVSASKAAKRCGNLISEMRLQRAEATAPVEVRTDPDSILLLMDQVSAALLQASKVAKAHGANRLANTLRQSLTRHVGRTSRVSQRVENPGVSNSADADDAQAMARRILGGAK
jgi:hypothetical protein